MSVIDVTVAESLHNTVPETGGSEVQAVTPDASSQIAAPNTCCMTSSPKRSCCETQDVHITCDGLGDTRPLRHTDRGGGRDRLACAL